MIRELENVSMTIEFNWLNIELWWMNLEMDDLRKLGNILELSLIDQLWESCIQFTKC